MLPFQVQPVYYSVTAGALYTGTPPVLRVLVGSSLIPPLMGFWRTYVEAWFVRCAGEWNDVHFRVRLTLLSVLTRAKLWWKDLLSRDRCAFFSSCALHAWTCFWVGGGGGRWEVVWQGVHSHVHCFHCCICGFGMSMVRLDLVYHNPCTIRVLVCSAHSQREREGGL